VIGICIGFITGRDLGIVWGNICGVGAFLISQLTVMLILRGKLKLLQNSMQISMQNAQDRIARQMQNFQQRPVGSPKFMQQKLESMQNDALREALRQTEKFNPFYRWNWMLAKQISTMKMQLHFQLKEFAEVDKLLPKCLLMDVRSMAIKLVRMYKLEDPKIDKFYQKKSRRLKGEDGAFLACVYAWIKLRSEEQPKALAALVAAKSSSDNPTLVANYENLINGKIKHFSNAGFGDLWYSLFLEEPKIKPQKAQQRMF
jgi:hypothetical protein